MRDRRFSLALAYSLVTLALMGCQENPPIAKVIFVQETHTTPAPTSTKPSILLLPESPVLNAEVIAAPLNHYTSMAVGLYKNQYAIVVKTNPKAKHKGNITPDLPLPSTQAFGDEIIEDEVVEEPIRVAPSRREISTTNAVVAEGPGADPFRSKPDTMDEQLAEKSGKVSASTDAIFDVTQIDAAYLLGKFNPATHPAFTTVEKKYGSKAGMYIRKDTYAAYLKMYEAAAKEGIKLNILSATRSFSGQKRIWEAKWTGRRKVGGQDLSLAIPFGADRAKKILEFSAMPGTSRHHWGTDMDLCALNNIYFESGQGKKIYDWLVKNAAQYGFHQPYTAARNTGHSEEKWHWSYTPVSKQLTNQYTRLLTNETITGFLGEETAKDIQIMEKYVLGVDEACK